MALIVTVQDLEGGLSLWGYEAGLFASILILQPSLARYPIGCSIWNPIVQKI